MGILICLGIVAFVAIILFFVAKAKPYKSDMQYEIQQAQAINDAHMRHVKLHAERDQILARSYQTRPQPDNTMMDNVLGYVVADATGIPINFTPGAIVGMMNHASHETSTTHHDASPSYDSVSTSSSYDSSSSSSYDSGSSSSSGGDF
jgi:hypothetical protein